MQSYPVPTRSALSPLLTAMYGVRRLRALAVRTALRLEGGAFSTVTVRELLARHHGVEVGDYSYGPCLIPGAFPAGVTIGRYVSIAQGVSVLRRNHPSDRLSTHPAFFNKNLRFVGQDEVPFLPLTIGHDAWIGERAIITAGCGRIGVGAIVGSAAVVTKDVPDFAIVGGVPAKLIRYRFPEEVRQRVLASRWWERDLRGLAEFRGLFMKELHDSAGAAMLDAFEERERP
jgi:virginiamycin A acetyltransferase